MIGTSAFLLTLVWPLVAFCCFAAAGIAIGRSFVRRRRVGSAGQDRIDNILIFGAAGLFCLIPATQQYNALQGILTLHELPAREIVRIEVGSTAITDPTQVTMIVSALAETQVYRRNHEPLARPLGLRMLSRTGKQYAVSVAHNPSLQGSVLGFPGEMQYFAFNAELPRALAAAGIHSPSDGSK